MESYAKKSKYSLEEIDTSWRKKKSKSGLGFRDLETFNKAILAKKIWRLFESPHSLAAHILKSKYFPTFGVLDVKLGSNPSLIWHSFQYSIDLVKDDFFLRIGDGQLVHIWGDNWVPNSLTLHFQPSNILLDSKVLMSNLIDLDTQNWNYHLITQMFNSDLASFGYKIPLSLLGTTDKPTWIPVKNEVFSVKSAYALETTRERRKYGEP